MTLTGVSGPLSVAHNSPEGKLHGHTYKVIAWWRGGDARERKQQLLTALAQWDHDLLPDDLAWAEQLGESIGHSLPGCVKVQMIREEEGMYAEWSLG